MGLCRPWTARREMACLGLARPGPTWLGPIGCGQGPAWCPPGRRREAVIRDPGAVIPAPPERAPDGPRRRVRVAAERARRPGPDRRRHAGRNRDQRGSHASAGLRPAAGRGPVVRAPGRPAGRAAARRRVHPHNPWRERIPPNGCARADGLFVGFTRESPAAAGDAVRLALTVIGYGRYPSGAFLRFSMPAVPAQRGWSRGGGRGDSLAWTITPGVGHGP